MIRFGWLEIDHEQEDFLLKIMHLLHQESLNGQQGKVCLGAILQINLQSMDTPRLTFLKQ